VDTKTFAEIVGVSYQDISLMVREGALTPIRPNVWADDAVAKYCDALRAKIRSQAGSLRAQSRSHEDTPKEKDAMDRYRVQKARIARYQADVMGGKLVNINVVEKFIVDMVIRANSRLEGIPDAVAANVRPLLADGRTATEVKKLVSEKVREAQNELSQHYERTTADSSLRDITGDDEEIGEEDS
jgi:hypothetical protein